ncbi:MAG: hypothetical protein ACREUL_10005 [Steroidobacteraceae bacterium]
MTASIPNPMRHRPASLVRPILCALAALIPSTMVLGATLPTAPQTFDTTYAPPSGSTITVPAGGNLQTALNNAKLGDTIVLQAGATYRGPFTLPDKTTGSGWIYVVSSNYSSLPAPGKRVSPSDAANMPEILARAYGHALITVADSNHFRFVGIEFAPEPGAFVYTLVQIGNGDTSPATLPNNIVFDRCYIRADPVADDRRGVEMDGAYVAVIDSYISGFQQTGTDSQGLWAYNTTGPLKIVDDYIEAASEDVMFGGAASKAASLVPSDIDIENNYFYKPLSLMGSSYALKNLLELKAGRRVLVSGNTFQNNPAGAQDGFALLITPRTISGKAPWTTDTDISIVGNTFINVGSGLNFLGCDNTYSACQSTSPPVMTERILVQNNLLEVTGIGNADGREFQFLAGGSDYTIDHNTVINTAPSPDSDVVMVESSKTSRPITNFVFTNNLLTPTHHGFFGSGAGTGTAALNREFSNWTFLKNVLAGENASNYPTGNFFPVSIDEIQFTDYAGGNYVLAAGSPYHSAGTDGKDIGAGLSSTGVALPSAPSDLTVQ